MSSRFSRAIRWLPCVCIGCVNGSVSGGCIDES